MEYLSKFDIPFSSLPYGVHRYEYEIEDKFFACFENSVIQKGKIHVNLDIDRQETMLILDFEFKGSYELECDRCLEKFDFPIDGYHNLIIKLAQETDGEPDDDVITLSSHEQSMHIAQPLYDYLSLLIPYRKTHPDDEQGESTCDPEFLKKLEGLSHHEENHNDPRWEALKKLKKK
ncbi:MAG: DUF177 domain-containing protein [Bacteroidota bacterium]